ncbi:MAG: hypothetical protein K2J73_08790 [Oscillospiraceae bacterium]|nr:hypothetical protein [Oscillospiraceae bacterium]
MSPTSKSQQRAVHKYVKNNYDRINLTVYKGQREIIRNHAERQDETLNGFVNRAIAELMEREGEPLLVHKKNENEE